jgi:Spy/CpxP family protein refolding chaperone
MLGTVAAAGLVLVACSDSPTQPSENEDDYSLVMFGQSGSALEGTLGPQGGRPFDGRSGAPRLPEALALSDEQRTEIEALREAFKADHQTELDAMRAIFEEARDAREGGASRDEVRAILEEGRTIGQGLREEVHALHEAILGVLTDEQREWLESHRPRPPRGLDAQGPRGPGGPPRR